MFQQSAFYVKNSLGEFIGIVAHPTNKPALVAAQITWGRESAYTELDAYELAKMGRDLKLPIFTATVQ